MINTNSKNIFYLLLIWFKTKISIGHCCLSLSDYSQGTPTLSDVFSFSVSLFQAKCSVPVCQSASEKSLLLSPFPVCRSTLREGLGLAFLLLIQHKAIAIYIARTSHILSPGQLAHLERLTAVPIILPLAEAVFVLVAAALCHHTPVPPTAERTKMRQDLGQTKALTEKEWHFHRTIEFFSDLQHGSTCHTCSTSRRVSWSVADFLAFAHILSHSLRLFIVPCVKQVILLAVCKAELQPALEVQLQQCSA